MTDSASITVTNHRLKKAMSNANDDDIKAHTKKIGDDLKSELSLKIGEVVRVYPVKDKAVVKLLNSNKEETCLIAHDILSEGMNVVGFPKGSTVVGDDGATYIVPSEKIYAVIMGMNDKKKEKVLLSCVSLSDNSVFGNAKAGEYKIQVGNNLISVTDKFINIKSKNLFVNGLPYTEAYTPLDDYYTKEEVEEEIDNRLSQSELVSDVLDTVYPIGSVYVSVNAINPSSIFGGSWERILFNPTGEGSLINDFYLKRTTGEIVLDYDTGTYQTDDSSSIDLNFWKRIG